MSRLLVKMMSNRRSSDRSSMSEPRSRSGSLSTQEEPRPPAKRVSFLLESQLSWINSAGIKINRKSDPSGEFSFAPTASTTQLDDEDSDKSASSVPTGVEFDTRRNSMDSSEEGNVRRRRLSLTKDGSWNTSVARIKSCFSSPSDLFDIDTDVEDLATADSDRRASLDLFLSAIDESDESNRSSMFTATANLFRRNNAIDKSKWDPDNLSDMERKNIEDFFSDDSDEHSIDNNDIQPTESEENNEFTIGESTRVPMDLNVYEDREDLVYFDDYKIGGLRCDRGNITLIFAICILTAVFIGIVIAVSIDHEGSSVILEPRAYPPISSAGVVPLPPDDIKVKCSASFISTEVGWEKCSELCKPAECCFSETNSHNCSFENHDNCKLYRSPCDDIYDAKWQIKEKEEIIMTPPSLSSLNDDDLCTPDSLETEGGISKCRAFCHPSQCCFTFLRSDNCYDSKPKICEQFRICKYFHTLPDNTDDAVIQPEAISSTISSNSIASNIHVPPAPFNLATVCSNQDYQSAEGYSQCNKICLQAECCFESAPDDNCREENLETCDDYEICNEVLK